MKTIDQRRQKRMDKKLEERSLVRLWRRKLKLWAARRNLNWVELEKPIRKGFQRTFILREDISKSPEANFFKGILNLRYEDKPLINTMQTCRIKEFTFKDWKTKKMIDMGQGIACIDHKIWNKLAMTAKQKSFFEKRWKVTNGIGRWVFEFTKPWMFVTKIEPHYLTRVKVIDPLLDSEITELENHVRSNGLMPKISKAMGFSNGWRDYYDMKRKALENSIDELTDDELLEFPDYGDYYDY